MLDSRQIEAFGQDGYLVLDEPILSKLELRALRERLDQVIRGESGGSPESLRNLAGGGLDSDRVVVQIVNIWEADSLFNELIYDSRFTSLTSQLIGDSTLRLWHDQIQYKPPRVGAPTDWHQDHPYWPITEPADLVSCWIALDDASLENGCMQVVPGSHKWGAAPGGLRGDDDFRPVFDTAAVPAGAEVRVEPCEIRAGSCMFHHCLTWHGSYYNRSDRPRRAIALHYMPGYTRYVQNGSHLVEQRVEVAPGQILKGKHFPTVLDSGVPVEPAPVEQPLSPKEQATGVS